MKDSSSTMSRRRFFAGTAAVAAATGVAVVARQAGQAGPALVTADATAEDKRFGSGISEHMRKYYRTTLI